MKQIDMLIIGGGPAGTSCARKLHQSGLDVLILDKKEFPREKVCGGWVTPQVFQALNINPEEYGVGRTLQNIKGFRTGVIGGKEIETLYPSVVSYGICRSEFDHYSLMHSGASCHMGKPLKSMEFHEKYWIVNGHYKTPLLVGAGGHFCPVARYLGNRKVPGIPVVKAQETEFEVSEQALQEGTIQTEIPELYFCDDMLGYGWCFRKGSYLNIGLGRIDSSNISRHIQGFCNFLKDRQKVVCEIPPLFHGHAYQLYEYQEPRIIDDHVLLIGGLCRAGLSTKW